MKKMVIMETYQTITDKGLTVWAHGKSMIENGSLLNESSIKIPQFKEVRKVLILWSGEVKEKTSDYTRLTLQIPRSKRITMPADKAYETKSNGILYACVADITEEYHGKGVYRISNIQSDPITANDDNRPSYSCAGYSIVIVYQDPDIQESREVMIKSNLLVLKPGELHELRLYEEETQNRIIQITTIGGHGLKGNASANLLNGISFSGTEDWDGSSGTHWDVDSVMLDPKDTREASRGYVLGFDPLLQWIYPIAVITVSRNELQ
ncbi:MAG: hypothetical protein GF384_08720 [Elusimicrobia bacterium]|nr:hypothetical protein [Elusimicrobiota bacterium]MBD3412694.1 hypothetical protein [Elusimicrobiota bacterium]